MPMYKLPKSASKKPKSKNDFLYFDQGMLKFLPETNPQKQVPLKQ